VTFTITKEYWDSPLYAANEHYFISIEKPSLTLVGVVEGMLDSVECQRNPVVRQRYTAKVFAILRILAKALRHLHLLGIAHGKVNQENCCKYEENWKLAAILGVQKIGETIRISRLSASSPPECFEPSSSSGSQHQASFRFDYITSPAMDVWSFGKLAYEVLMGRDLIELDRSKRFEDDHRAMMDIMHWNSFNCEEVRQELMQIGVIGAGADMVALCLDPNPKNRPFMDEILNCNLWKELRKAGASV